MSKKRKVELVNLVDWSVNSTTPLNWTLCVICQTPSDQHLITPTQAGYESLASNLQQFVDRSALQSSVRIDRMNDGSGIENTLMSNNAKYHKMCRSKYNSRQLERIASASTTVLTVSDSGDDESQLPTSSGARSTRSASNASDIKKTCIFCDGVPENSSPLVAAMTKDTGPNIYTRAVELQDTKLLAKLSGDDFVALEVKYHKICYVKFLTRFRSHERCNRDTSTSHPHRHVYGSVISELVQYMEHMFLYGSTAPVFKLSELLKRMSCAIVFAANSSLDDAGDPLSMPEPPRIDDTKLTKESGTDSWWLNPSPK